VNAVAFGAISGSLDLLVGIITTAKNRLGGARHERMKCTAPGMPFNT
jgi:hypothetical protein